MANKIHIVDENNYKACEHKSIPEKYRYKRVFNFGWADTDKITCIKCKKATGEPYYSDEY